jgi:hypothetical protein
MITFSNLGNLGRLGNQLFQISSVIGHSMDNGYSYGFPDWKYSGYLKTPLPVIDNFSAFSKFVERDPWAFQNIPKNDNIDLYGYFQNPLYFDSHRDMIFQLLTPTEEIEKRVDEIMGHHIGKRITAIHIRRGDYLKFPGHHPIPHMDYYNKSIEILRDDTDLFMVFSDDIEWCREQFIGNFIFSDEIDEFIDLLKMSKCDNFIIANSSFSWWGSYLCKNNNKKTIAPFNWVGPEYKNKGWEQVYRKEMIKI